MALNLIGDGCNMPRTMIQIYEIQDPTEAESLLDLGVDRLGSVLISSENWKVPSIRQTIACVKRRSGQSSLIPLFSDRDLIFRVLDWYEPHVIHLCESLCGSEGLLDGCDALITLQADIKKHYPEVQIMRSVPIAETGRAQKVPTLELARLFEPVSDVFLTDTLIVGDGDKDKEQPVQGFVGITGITCDWGMAAKLIEQSGLPVILAGGLSPDNVYEAVLATRPAGVDSCTQTNRVGHDGQPIRFQKDLDKVKTFVAETIRAEHDIQKTP
jgi:phosphoribosylanthranilate isomerase